MHRFDGDGMVHACRIKDGRVSYANHWVRTSKLAQEQAAGKPIFMKVRAEGGCGMGYTGSHTPANMYKPFTVVLLYTAHLQW